MEQNLCKKCIHFPICSLVNKYKEIEEAIAKLGIKDEAFSVRISCVYYRDTTGNIAYRGKKGD